MRYTREQLADYVLGLLDPGEMQEIEQHLQTSKEAQLEVDRLKSALFQLADELPPMEPQSDSWEKIQAKLAAQPAANTPGSPSVSQPESPAQTVVAPTPAPLALPRFVAWAAVVAVLALGGWFGTQSYLAGQAERQEAQTIQQWLAEAQPRPINTAANVQVAQVVIREDGQGMIIMNEKADAEHSFQAWGIKDGQPVSLGVIHSRTIQVDTRGYQAIAVSLEPAGGNPTPTQVLGAVPVG